MISELTALPWRDLFANIPLGILVLDGKAGRVVFCNPAMEGILASIKPVSYAKVMEIFAPADHGGPEGGPLRQTVTLDGKKIGFTVYSPGPDSRLLLASDVSDKSRREQIAASAELMSTIDYTFFNLAHELGNPINSIKMTLEVLINNFKEYNDKTKLEYLANLHSEFSRLEGLLKAIKSFNMFEHLSIRPTNVGALLENLLHLLAGEIDKKHIEVKSVLPADPILASSDPQALQQVLLNLMSNAIDAVAETGDPQVAIHVGRAGHQVRISIKDNGCGIPDHKKKELFLPFFSGKSQGIGLGLSIVKKLLTQMDATIEISSQQQQGHRGADHAARSSRP